MSTRTVTVDVDVDVDLDDFSDHDLIHELEHRGYSAKKGKPEFSWLKTSYEEDELDEALWRLRESYIIDNSEQFRKSFEKILAEFGYFV
jgi:hypothetical protein